MNGEVALLGWAFGIASGLFAIFCVVAAVRLSRRSFPDLGHHLSDGERGGGGRPAWPAQSAGAASRQSFARYHRQLRREIRRDLRGNHLR